MSREIKFRAWNKKHSYFIGDFFIGDDGDVYTESSAFDDYYTEMNVIPFDEVVLQQYTGIKDKNGKEIYEGDLVSTDLSRKFNIVSYRAGGFIYECHDKGEDYTDRMKPCWDIDNIDKYGEVIGNIYENEELLK